MRLKAVFVRIMVRVMSMDATSRIGYGVIVIVMVMIVRRCDEDCDDDCEYCGEE